MTLLSFSAAGALCLAGIAFWAIRSFVRHANKRVHPQTSGVSTVGEDFEEFVKKRQTVMLSPASQKPPAIAETGPHSRTIDLGDGVGFELGIVGESHYLTVLQRLASRLRAAGARGEFIATLMPEPDNKFDDNAVVVLSDFGEQIGYLSRDAAASYAAVIGKVTAQGAVARCRAKLAGGTPQKPNIGVWLDIDPPDALLARLAAAESDQPF